MLTTAAAGAVAALHDRMPVIVAPRDYAAWLDPGLRDPQALRPLFAGAGADALRATAVSRRVNRVEHDDPGCLEPLPPDPQGSLFP